MNIGNGLRGTLGERIRRLRKEKGYTLNSFAKKARFSNAYLSKIERALVEPTDDILSKILVSLDVSYTTLSDPEMVVISKDGGQLPESEILRPSCLIIEWDSFWQKIQGTLLTDEGFSLDVASERERALELTKANTYDLITLDLTLDSERRFYWGLQLLENLKASGHKIPPIIVVSGTTDIDVVIDVLNHYPVAYFARKHSFSQSAIRSEFREATFRIAAKASRRRMDS